MSLISFPASHLSLVMNNVTLNTAVVSSLIVNVCFEISYISFRMQNIADFITMFHACSVSTKCSSHRDVGLYNHSPMVRRMYIYA